MSSVCHYCGGSFAPPPLLVDLSCNMLFIEGQKIKVFPRAAELFHVLLEAYPKYVSPGTLAEKLWGIGDGPQDEYMNIKVQIYQLRQMLQDTRWRIRNRRSLGYRLERI